MNCSTLLSKVSLVCGQIFGPKMPNWTLLDVFFQFFSLRNRPDLLEWRKVERMRVRERIDLAFHVMEREYGVTRLLDPEGEER